MTPDIHELDPTTVERIAAGEVVERPASAVKELVENAIDADASRVSVAVEAGGTEGIRVADDGHGMSEAELRQAVREHTTSKIGDIADLEGGVSTLGFRGEALHAIGAVSRLTIRSRPRGGDRGTELVVEGGDVVDATPAGCPEGTIVEVADLFYNVPARREYLKAVATEFDHVNRVVSGYALANPDVAVSLEHDGRETFATDGRGELREAVMAVYGREVAAAMVPVEPDADALPPGPLTAVEGLVSHPETNRSTRDYVATFVNGRYVTAGDVREAIVTAYGRQLAPDRYPFAILSLQLPPSAVDVNVHPRKLEVRFADAAGVRTQVETAVEAALLDAGLIRSSAPRGRSAPEQTEISPERADSTEGAADGEEGETAANPRDSDRTRAVDPVTDGTTRDASDGPRQPSPASGRTEGHSADPEPAEAGSPGSEDGDPASATDDPHAARSSHIDRFQVASAQATLEGATVEFDREFDRLPPIRVLGQLHGTYLLAETSEGLLLIDQHAADERVNYERLRERFDEEVTTQVLAEPVELELTARELALFEAHRDALARLGFHATATDERTVEVRTVPAVIADAADPSLLQDVLGAFVGGDPAETVEATADRLLADLACYPSITGNTSLGEGTVLELLEGLDGCENPYACPHGRPVFVEVSKSEIEARFERDYPGHQDRRAE